MLTPLGIAELFLFVVVLLLGPTAVRALSHAFRSLRDADRFVASCRKPAAAQGWRETWGVLSPAEEQAWNELRARLEAEREGNLP
jgi:hypothetical protein